MHNGFTLSFNTILAEKREFFPSFTRPVIFVCEKQFTLIKKTIIKIEDVAILLFLLIQRLVLNLFIFIK